MAKRTSEQLDADITDLFDRSRMLSPISARQKLSSDYDEPSDSEMLDSMQRLVDASIIERMNPLPRAGITYPSRWYLVQMYKAIEG